MAYTSKQHNSSRQNLRRIIRHSRKHARKQKQVLPMSCCEATNFYRTHDLPRHDVYILSTMIAHDLGLSTSKIHNSRYNNQLVATQIMTEETWLAFVDAKVLHKIRECLLWMTPYWSNFLRTWCCCLELQSLIRLGCQILSFLFSWMSTQCQTWVCTKSTIYKVCPM